MLPPGPASLCRLKLCVLALAAAPFAVGGQAVLGGVMMRAPRAMTVAVRRRDGSITLQEQSAPAPESRPGVLRLPFVRGAVVLVESLKHGLSALRFSARCMEEDLAAEEAERTGKAPEARTSDEGPLSLVVSVALAVALFVALPHALAWLTGQAAGGLPVDGFGFHLVDGLFKLGIFVGYLALIGRIPEITGVFRYHGAEHKSVHCQERGRPLVTTEAQQFSTAHPRCGTSLLLWVVALSVFIFAGVLPMLPPLSENPWLSNVGYVLIKVPLMFPLAGLAYELQRLGARNPDGKLMRVLLSPGMRLQALTTRPPSDDEVEVALVALRGALALDGAARGMATTVVEPRTRSFGGFAEATTALG
ncbi:MAG: DUF1385 domain-containing protein [Myxococcota bacterium]